VAGTRVGDGGRKRESKSREQVTVKQDATLALSSKAWTRAGQPICEKGGRRKGAGARKAMTKSVASEEKRDSPHQNPHGGKRATAGVSHEEESREGRRTQLGTSK